MDVKHHVYLLTGDVKMNRLRECLRHPLDVDVHGVGATVPYGHVQQTDAGVGKVLHVVAC